MNLTSQRGKPTYIVYGYGLRYGLLQHGIRKAPIHPRPFAPDGRSQGKSTSALGNGAPLKLLQLLVLAAAAAAATTTR